MKRLVHGLSHTGISRTSDAHARSQASPRRPRRTFGSPKGLEQLPLGDNLSLEEAVGALHRLTISLKVCFSAL